MADSDSFCATPFWDLSVVWYTETPELTPCFENTLLLWIPVAFVWISGLISLCQRKNKDDCIPIPQTFINITKFLSSLMLTGLFLTSFLVNFLGENLPEPSPASMTADLAKMATCGFVLVLQILDQQQGKRASNILFIFWFLFLVCSLPSYYRVVNHTYNEQLQPPTPLEFAVVVSSFPFIFIEFSLSSICDSRLHKDDAISPFLKASPMSKLLFEWITPLITLGYRQTLRLVDLFPILPMVKSVNNWNLWHKTWIKMVSKSSKAKTKRKPPSLLISLGKTFWVPLLIGTIYDIIFVVMRIMPALVLNLIIDFMSNEEEVWKGYLYAGTIFLICTSSTFFVRHADYFIIVPGLRLKSVLIAAIYRKALRISSRELSKYTVGELVNLISVDADKIYQLSAYVGISIGAPVNLLVTIFLLWQYLGPSCLAGLAVIIFMMPLTGAVARKCRSLQEKQMELKDSRLKYMGEILNSVKILKFYAWEIPFADRVRKIRQEEVSVLKKFAYFSALMRFFWTCTPFLVSLFAFMTFVLVSDKNILDPTTAFVSLSLFNGMRFSLAILPDLVSNAVQTSVSIRRINTFLNCEEMDVDLIGSNPKGDDVITFDNVDISWDKEDEPLLKDLNLSIKKGQLIAVVGQVGSGKSSLLSSILGDLHVHKGSIDVSGSIAYVPQQAWIQNSTVKKNILFTSPFVSRTYNKILDVCCLRSDIDMLPGGEMTEIGEKGVNLSGGQKQRISLARAAYQDRDVYLLDDPLSAVDAHVGSAIFLNVIGPKGILKNKTRILVTNSLSVLPDVDSIVVLKEGRIVEHGTYDDLMDSKGKFSEFVNEYLLQKEKEEEVKQDVIEFERKIQRSVSEMRAERSMSVTETSTFFMSERVEEFMLIKEEVMESGTIKSSVYINYLKNIGLPLIVVIVIGFTGFRAFDIASGLWLSIWSNDPPLPDGSQDISLRNMRMGIYALLGLLQGVFSFFGTAMLAKGTMTASRRLHDYMLNSVLKAPMAFFDTTPFGRILNRFGKDVDQLDIQLPLMSNVFMEMLFQLIGMMVLISLNLPIFLAVAVPVLIIYVIIQRIYLSSLRQLKRLESVTRSPVYNHFSESISGLSSIRGYCVQDIFVNRSDERVDITQNCTYLITVAQRWMQTRLDFLGNVLIVAVAILVVASRGTMDAGSAGFLLSYSLSTAVAFNFLIHFAAEAETAIVAAERLSEYSSIPPEAAWSVEPKPDKTWPQEGQVTFNDYSTRYREGLDLVLKGIDLDFKPGEKIGVVGRTGAGKSSLTLSLFRIIEATSGKIVIDNTDIAKIGLHDLRSKLTIIPQDPVLFSGSLRINLDPNNEYPDLDLWVALERAHIKEQFKNGLETEVAEGGSNLSVGQRQLVCLARAILKKTKVLILDEATAAVDLETDALIQETIRKDFAECTIITIAHRLHTILDSDRIIVMASGQVREQGAPGDLLKDKDSEFYGMAKEVGIV